MKNKDLKRRIIEISYKYKLSHIGSCLTAVDMLEDIFTIKKKDEKFVLSCGHSGLALYTIFEKYRNIDAEKIFNHHGVHPDRCEECGIDCSSGSLGQGLAISVGMALADRKKNVYCLISDGEMSEGSCYEALDVAHEQNISNLKVYINCNGWGAYKALDRDHIIERSRGFTNVNMTFTKTNVNDFSFLKGQDAHYHIMGEEDYKLAMKILK